MSREFISVRGANQWAIAMEAAVNTAETEAQEALRDSANILARAIRDRVYPAESLNKQDSKRPRSLSQRKPVTVRVQGMRAEVELRSYWARARSQAVFGTLNSLGLRRLTERKALVVGPNERRVRFSRAPRLREWAQQGDAPLTWQFHKHTVRLPAEALGPLAMYPARAAVGGKIHLRMVDAHQAFLKAANR